MMSSAPGTPITKLTPAATRSANSGVIGVADIDAHRHAHELAAKMIFQSGARDLLAVVQIFRTDKADDAVDQERLERARHRVGARLQRLLVDAVVRIGGERAALPGLEIHHIVSNRAAAKRQRGRARLLYQGEGASDS